MFVSEVRLVDFRSYENVDLEFSPGVTVLLGQNGQGKTNIVEALEYLGTLKSHRVSTDAPLVRLGQERAQVAARVQAGLADSRSLAIELTINAGRANQARMNQVACRPRDLIGALRVVFFSPQDLAIVKGDPVDRRRFIDEITVLRWPRIAGVKADYDRVLKQRNALLRGLNGRLSEEDRISLQVWDESLVRYGSELMAARISTLSDMAKDVADAYRDLAPVNNEVEARYESSVSLEDVSVAGLAAALSERLALRRELEVLRGVTLVGPQRDDIALSLGPFPAKGYASHGESWSLALALRLGAFQLARRENIEPILVLDDVFAELDSVRRERLAGWVAQAEQVFITTAAAEDIPSALRGQRFLVAQGAVVKEES